MTSTRMVFTKWGGLPHWEYDALVLGEDRHGCWLGLPPGTRLSRPGATFDTSESQVVLVPDAPFVAAFSALGSTSPCDIYVDISTEPVLDGGQVTCVDLDLDVVRGRTGRVWVDDEDEFADHRVRFGYPDELVELALSSCEGVRRAVEMSIEPFDGLTAKRWLDALDGAMMTR
jgi:hypothetical protein